MNADGEVTGYLAPEGLLDQVIAELADVRAVHGRLVLATGAQPSVWAQNVWHDVHTVEIRSIGDAVRHLKGLQRNWWPYQHTLHRRTQLIQAKLPYVSAKPLAFPSPCPTAPLGSYTLIEPTIMLASAHCTSPFPNGEPTFEEFKSGPPSRAYLKLFEGLTRIGRRPGPGERCLDLGASPGGWTWVLARLGAEVKAYDRAPLDAAILAMPGVNGIEGDAFQARPEKVGPIDWLFSDVICYPERLLEHVRLWLDAGACKNFFCTLKFQGTAHYAVIPEFLKIPGSRIMHLHANKHELTWVKVDDRF